MDATGECAPSHMGASDAKFKLWEGLQPAEAPPTAAALAAAAQSAPEGGEARATLVEAAGGAASVRWACRSVGYYRQTAATSVAFSVDGSLLAVAYAPDVVTLWDPLTNEMLHALCQPLASPSDTLSFVGFPYPRGVAECPQPGPV